jgi:peptidoglycan/xylan/chitin deacetylase (PgdA/CDA1 family)
MRGGEPKRWHRTGRWVTGAGSVALLAHYVPSVCVLGQWSPVPLRALPYGWCRWSGPDDTDAVALTFDDGPSGDATPRTLDLLDRFGMGATFFVLGSQAETHPGLVAEIRSRGHTIGSHGHRHERHLRRSPGWIAKDLAASVEAIGQTGARPRWYRPTYGQLTARTVLEARRNRMEVVLWSAWGREWAQPAPEPVVARLGRGLRPGAILLLHDNDVSCPPGTAARTHRALELLAGELDARGLRAVSLDDLLGPRPLVSA